MRSQWTNDLFQMNVLASSLAQFYDAVKTPKKYLLKQTEHWE